MNKQKSTEQTKKQQKTWIKIIKIVGIVLICLILFALIAFGVLRALGKSGIRKNISGEAPVLESTESTEEGWQDGWIRYNGQIYAYNEDIMTFLVMGVDNDDVVKKAKDGLSGGQADAMFLAVMNPHDKSVSIIAVNRNAMALVDVYDEDGVYMGQYTKQITLQHGYGDGMELSCERSVAAVSRLFYNLPISGYAAINMGAIPALNDAVGGVQVTVLDDALIITTISGFVPQFEMNDVRILQENGYTVHYASDFENPIYNIDQTQLKRDGLILHHIDIRKSPFQITKNTKAFLQLKQIIRKEQISLVHCHNPMGGVVGRLAAKASGREPYVVYTAHGFHFYEGAPKKNWLLYYTAERFLAAFTDRIITINREDYERANRFRLKEHGCVEQIPGVGVNIEKFRKKPELREIKRKELDIPPDGFHIVSVGELVENKNHAVVIEAVARLHDENIYYSICGKGPYRETLEHLIQKHHLEKQVRLLGYRNDVQDVLQSADCFAFPSKREGLGIAAIEALACEVPVIASDNRGSREYMCHTENGIVCQADKVADFMHAICRMRQSGQLRREMGEHGRRTAERFSIEATDKIMRRVYQEISVTQERKR